MKKIQINSSDPSDPYSLFSNIEIPKKKPGTIRVWLDGCFDMLHHGHSNVIRQANLLGDELFVGCHSDLEIESIKGPPVMPEIERYSSLHACKWVHYVIENYPYNTRLKDMAKLEIDFVIHGDDVSIGLDGRHSYHEIVKAGLFKTVERTKGVSTTDLIERMLTPEINTYCTENHSFDPSLIGLFSNTHPISASDDAIFLSGNFDLFNTGHIERLEVARGLGKKVCVGIYDDRFIREIKGEGFPIMNLFERALCLLSCRYVDEVYFSFSPDNFIELFEEINPKIILGGCDIGDEHFIDNCYAEFRPFHWRKFSADKISDNTVQNVRKNRERFLKKKVIHRHPYF